MHLILWIKNFLADRSQRVRIENSLSDILITNTGVPQGCVLSPKLFSLYTSDYTTQSGFCSLNKYADDTALSGMIFNDNETAYRNEVSKLVQWCEDNSLVLNVKKTKEMIFDFRRDRKHIEPIEIHNETVDIVTEYKYLGTCIDNQLNWKSNTKTIFKRANQRMYFLRKLKSFKVDDTILKLFYQSTIQSVVTFCRVVRFHALQVSDRKKI